MTDTFRAMCAELFVKLKEWDSSDPYHDCGPLLCRARALLAQPVAEGLTDEELRGVFVVNGAWPGGLRAVADLAADRARHGRPTPQPVAEVPTTAELMSLSAACNSPSVFAHAVLARWGRPTPQPVAVSERLPGAEDCLDEGWAWFFNQRIGWRQAVLPVSPGYTHWLPANALPIPEAQ